MTTVQEGVTRALRYLSVVNEGHPAPAAYESDIGLQALKALYVQLVTGGRFGPITDVAVTAAYTAGENERIADLSGVAVAVTLPASVVDAVTGLSRAVEDRSVVQIVGGSTWIYDTGQGAWVDTQAITLASQLPLGHRFMTALAALLAVVVAPELGVSAPETVVTLAESGRAQLRAKKPIRVSVDTAMLRGLAQIRTI